MQNEVSVFIGVLIKSYCLLYNFKMRSPRLNMPEVKLDGGWDGVRWRLEAGSDFQMIWAPLIPSTLGRVY